MSGDGVDCAQDRLDPSDVLQKPLTESAGATADLLLGCIRQADLGAVITMYALGFGDESDRYVDVVGCVADATGTADAITVRTALVSIFEARLDLLTPPTSPDIARNYLETTTDCLTASTTSDTTTTTTPSTPVVTGQVQWDRLRAGQCVVDLPEGDFVEVTVTDCSQPHESEVVGTDLPMTGTEQARCDTLFTDYTGQDISAFPDYAVDVLVSTDTFANAVLICLASSLSGAQTTGSLTAG